MFCGPRSPSLLCACGHRTRARRRLARPGHRIPTCRPSRPSACGSASISTCRPLPRTGRRPGQGLPPAGPGGGLYMITDNAYQSMFLVYDKGVVVIDTPPKLCEAPARGHRGSERRLEADHTRDLQSLPHRPHRGYEGPGGHPAIIAQEETLELLQRAKDPNRPLPTVTSRTATRCMWARRCSSCPTTATVTSRGTSSSPRPRSGS